jgi:hypothetical protein
MVVVAFGRSWYEPEKPLLWIRGGFFIGGGGRDRP